MGTKFFNPRRIKIDDYTGRVYVADIGNSSISVLDKIGNVIEKIQLEFSPKFGFFIGKNGQTLILGNRVENQGFVVILNLISKSVKAIPLPSPEFSSYFCVSEMPAGQTGIANKLGMYILSKIDDSQKAEIPSVGFEWEIHTEDSGIWEIRKIMNSLGVYKTTTDFFVDFQAKTLFGISTDEFCGSIYKYDLGASKNLGEQAFYDRGFDIFRGIHVDRAGTILICSARTGILVMNSQAEIISELPCSNHTPTGVTVDEDGNIFVTYSDRDILAGIFLLEPSSE